MNNKIKILTLILFMFIITGCSATYKVEINDDIINENLTINSNFTKNQIDAYTNNPIPININYGCFLDYDVDGANTKTEKIDGINYYNIEFEDNKKMKVTSKVGLNEYNDSRIANSLFNNVHVNNYEDMFSIYGYNGITIFQSYPNLQKVKVEITTNKKVIKHDADEVNNKKYIWYFDKSTNQNRTIYLELSKDKIEEEKKIGYSVYIIIGIFIVSLVGLIIVKIYNSKK